MGRSIPKANPEPGDVDMSSDAWCSGPEIATPLYRFWGRTLDPCSNERSLIQTHTAYTEGGLVRHWVAGHLEPTAFANWPYSTNDPWASKAIYELRLGALRELVVLCMMAPSTRWWLKLMTEPRRNPRVIATKRLKFLGPDGVAMDSSRFDPALIYYGSRTAAFDKAFKHVAVWSTWGR